MQTKSLYMITSVYRFIGKIANDYKFLYRHKPVNGYLNNPPPPPGKICLGQDWGLGFWSRLGLVLGLGSNKTIAQEENFLVRVRLWIRVILGVGAGDKFTRGQLS